jgi:hypothetical protein
MFKKCIFSYFLFVNQQSIKALSILYLRITNGSLFNFASSLYFYSDRYTKLQNN